MDEDLPRPKSRDRVVGEWVWSGQVPWLPSDHPVRDEMRGVMERTFPKSGSEQQAVPPFLAKEKQKQVSFNLTSTSSSSKDNPGAEQALGDRKESASNDLSGDESAGKSRSNSLQTTHVRTRHSSLIDLPLESPDYCQSLTEMYLKNISSVPVLETLDAPPQLLTDQFESVPFALNSANSLLPTSLTQRVPNAPRGILINRPPSEIPWSITATGGPSDSESYHQVDIEGCQAVTPIKFGQPKPYTMSAQGSPSNPDCRISLPEPSFRLASGLSSIFFPNLKSNQLSSNQTDTHFLHQTQTKKGILQTYIGPFSERSKLPDSPSSIQTSRSPRDKKNQTQSQAISSLPFPVPLPSQTISRCPSPALCRYPSQIVYEYPSETIKQYSSNIFRTVFNITPSQLPRQPSNPTSSQPHSHSPSKQLILPPSKPPIKPPSKSPRKSPRKTHSKSPSKPPSQTHTQPASQPVSQYSSQLSTNESNSRPVRQRISLLPRPSFLHTSANSPCRTSGQHSDQSLELPYRQLSNQHARSSISQDESHAHPEAGDLMRSPYMSTYLEKLLLAKSTTLSKNECQNSNEALVRADSVLYGTLSGDRYASWVATGGASQNLPDDSQIAPPVFTVSLAAERQEALPTLALLDSRRPLLSGAKQEKESTRDSQSVTKVKWQYVLQYTRSRSPLSEPQPSSAQHAIPLLSVRHDGQVTPAAINGNKSGQQCSSATAVGPTASQRAQNAFLHQTCEDLTIASNAGNTGPVHYITIPHCNCKDTHQEKDVLEYSQVGGISELPLENLPLKKRFTRKTPEPTPGLGYQFQQMSVPLSPQQRYSTEASSALEAPSLHVNLDRNAPSTRTLAKPCPTEETSADQYVEAFYRLDTSPFKASRAGALPQPHTLGEHYLHTRNLGTDNLSDEKLRKPRNSGESLRKSEKRISGKKSINQTRPKSNSQSGQKSKSPRKIPKSADRSKLKSPGDGPRADGRNGKGPSSHVMHCFIPERPRDYVSSSHHYVDVDDASNGRDEHEYVVTERNELEFPGTAAPESREKDLFPLDVTGVRAMIADLDQTFGDLGHETESRGQPEDESRISEGETTDTAFETDTEN